jgi:putative ABC transport system permease protein
MGGGRPGGGTEGGLPQQTESLKIVGVADVNWHLITSRAQLRGRNNMPGGTMGPVFVSEADARRLSGNADTTSFLWLNLSESYRKMGALQGSQLLEAEIRKAIEIDEANTVRVHHRDEIEDGTIAHGSQLIGDMARAPFWSLIVLSTGLITLLVASFQASAKEIAVMRAVGMTRSQLGRMLFGEAMLIGLCGVVLSLISGFCIGWTFTGWTRAWMMFGGLPISLSVPWLVILQGVGFALFLCAAMAVPPIVWLVRKQDESGGLTVV